MAELPFEFCTVALEVRRALDERRIDDAKRIAIERLRAGYQSKPFFDIVAELLEIKKQPGKRGPKKKVPPHWYEIGNDFLEEMGEKRVSYQVACEKLAKKYNCSERTIATARAYFQEAQDAHDEASWEYIEENYEMLRKRGEIR